MNFQDSNQTDQIVQCINLVQKLRHGVGQVFKELSDGISDFVEESTEKESDGANSKSESSKESKVISQNQKDAAVAGGDKEEYQDKHRAILRTLKKSLETISHDFSDLEKMGATVAPVQPFSNIDNLSLDPVDKNTVMHAQLLQAYQWTNKMHELANQAVSVLSQNSLKRTNSPKFTSSKILKGSMHAACYVPPATVDQLIVSLSQSYKDMDISISRPLGNSGIVQIELRRVLRVIVVLRGLMIEWVKVKGIDETFETDDRQIDIWSSSRYQVFQKITDHAVAASLHYYAPAKPDLAIKSYLLWLQGYASLFSAPCHKCGKFLQNNLPPTWRDFRSREPFHDVCRM